MGCMSSILNNGAHLMLPIWSYLDWKTINRLWLALVLAKPSERPELIALRQRIMSSYMSTYFTMSTVMEIPDSCIDIAKELLQTVSTVPTESQIAQGKAALEKRSEENIQLYYDTVNQLVDALNEENLHWRQRILAMNFLRLLVHVEHVFPPKVIRYFLNALIHDSLEERKTAISTLYYIFRKMKREHPTVSRTVQQGFQ